MFKPQPVALQQGALRLDPLTEADLPGLLQLAEANRASQQFMRGTTRPDWYRSALAEQREGREVVFAIRLATAKNNCKKTADSATATIASSYQFECTYAGLGPEQGPATPARSAIHRLKPPQSARTTW